MVKMPFSESSLKKGHALVEKGYVKHIIFSEGTYQVEVVDAPSKSSVWPFLQLDDTGEVTDYFCTCKEGEKTGSCPHLAAALLQIYQGHLKPLHLRFRGSLWNLLMQMAAKRHGYDTTCLKKLRGEAGYYAQSLTKKRLFTIKALSKKAAKQLEEIIHHRVLETEETSLKFSNLSSEELSLWKEGKPSHHLQYELSFWSDLAKWMIALQESGQKYHIKLVPAQGTLPKEILILFKDLEVSFYIAEVNWEELIPALTLIDFPVPIYEYQDLVFDHIIYDEKEKIFHMHCHHLEELKAQVFKEKEEDDKQVPLGEWIYHPDIGFYPREIDPMLRCEVIPTELVGKMLTKYSSLLEKYLSNTRLYPGICYVSYHLFFDKQDRFHICAYLFEKGDLQKPESTQFGSWVFLADKGFYQLGSLLFNEMEKVILKQSLSEFVSKNKVWLNQYEGFQTHLTNIECYLTFGVDNWDRLYFKSTAGAFEETAGVLDLQEWVYIEGRGFYAKTASKIQQVLTPGLTILKEDVSSFIKSHEEDLEQIKGFFSLKQPVEKSGLEIFINEENRIVVKPKISLTKGYQLEQVKFFGDYSYVEKEGFSLLPKGGRIPDAYTQEKILEPEEEEDFIIEELSSLKPFILYIDPRLKQPKQLSLKIEHLTGDEGVKTQWDMHLVYVSEYGEVQVKDLWEAIKRKQAFVKTQAGLIFLQDTRFSWLRELSKHHFISDHTIQLTSLEWMRLSLLETIEPPTTAEARRFLEEIKLLQTSDTLSLEGLKSHLRPYQELGVKWLWFLYSYGLSGLLCDEMGLGKTHQAMALLAACRNAQKGKKFLVVCPTSVIYHWEELLRRFLPQVTVLVFYGIQRSLEGFFEEAEVLLTSYGTLRSEKDPLSEIHFEVAIFDELHVAKNAYSQTHKALRGIKARTKLGLTGTPIENRLLELHSLFDVILPHYLPSESLYKELFVVPIERNQDHDKKKLLSKLIQPFILRRKKEQVLQDLPEKTEEIAYVDLSKQQREMYKEICRKNKEEIFQELEQKEGSFPYMHIFALFNLLKQVCDHPALLNKDVENYEYYESGKWELFVELVHEARESGQKVVVFSQYLQMLDIIELFLKKQGIGYAQIRGSTKNRREEMKRFKEDPHCEIFIGSLQAAGVGIDLVSASVVIHYDRWWNPAKENQATDRVHRIGQSRGVQVFKLVSKDTVEEHIHHIIERKLTLLHDVVMYDDQDQVKQLDREELVQLLKKIDAYF
jgi:SNF2 family DNA or RNA helicase